MSNSSSASSEHDLAWEFGALMLGTLEDRRNQLAARSTVLAAASGAIVLAYVQLTFMDSSSKRNLLALLLELPQVCVGLLALTESLKVVSGVGKLRKQRGGSGRIRGHLLYYQTLLEYDKSSLAEKLTSMSREESFEQVSEQAISLSRNLVRRYVAIQRAFRLTVFSAVLLIVHILAIRYSDIVSSSFNSLWRIASWK